MEDDFSRLRTAPLSGARSKRLRLEYARPPSLTTQIVALIAENGGYVEGFDARLFWATALPHYRAPYNVVQMKVIHATVAVTTYLLAISICFAHGDAGIGPKFDAVLLSRIAIFGCVVGFALGYLDGKEGRLVSSTFLALCAVGILASVVTLLYASPALLSFVPCYFVSALMDPILRRRPKGNGQSMPRRSSKEQN